MGLVPGLDERVESLMTAVRLDSEQELAGWRTALQEACPADRPDLTADEFAGALRAAGGTVPAESVEYFVLTLESLGDGIRPVIDLVRTLEGQPDLYWQLYQQLYPAPESAGVDRFAWLGRRQVQRLSDGWGGDWQQYLGQQLDYRWGAGWEATYATEGSQGYLDALIAEWLPERPAPAPTAALTATLSADEMNRLIDEAIQKAVRDIPGAGQITAEDLAGIAERLRNRMAGSTQA